jgi:hypothetical protein
MVYKKYIFLQKYYKIGSFSDGGQVKRIASSFRVDNNYHYTGRILNNGLTQNWTRDFLSENTERFGIVSRIDAKVF